jgi:UDP-glucose 4-epimerase
MILITGGAGYVGGQFVRTYLANFPKEQVVVVDNLSEGHDLSLPKGNNVKFIEENIGNVQAMKLILSENKVEAVVHFAASAYVGESQTNPFKYYENNVISSINLFKAMEESHVRKIVFSSTCATYGNPKYIPLDESHPQEPVNVYGTTKWILEKVLRSLSETADWSYVALRYFNASGADDSGEVGESHDPETHLIPLVLKVAAGKLDHVDLYGNDYDTKDGTCIRDYIHVADLAQAHCAALEALKHGKAALEINLGTSVGASILEVLAMCKEVTGKEIATTFAPRRWGDPPVLVANYSKAAAQLNWQPRHDLRKIVESAWKWEQNRRY